MAGSLFPLSRDNSGINLRDVIPPPARNLRPKMNISKIGKTFQGFNIINKVKDVFKSMSFVQTSFYFALFCLVSAFVKPESQVTDPWEDLGSATFPPHVFFNQEKFGCCVKTQVEL